MPQEAIIVVDGEGNVVASVYLYETDLFMFSEYLVSSKDTTRRMKYLACMLLMHTLAAIAGSKGKFLLATPRSKGARSIMAKFGFRDSGFPMWVRPRKVVPLWEEDAGESDIPQAPERAPENGGRPQPQGGSTASALPEQKTPGPTGETVAADNRSVKPARVSRQGRRSGLG
jgi:hypothetical protein